MSTKPGYLAINIGCGCHWGVYRVSTSGVMDSFGKFESKAEAIATARRYNIEGGGYTPSFMPGQFDGLTPEERVMYSGTGPCLVDTSDS